MPFPSAMGQQTAAPPAAPPPPPAAAAPPPAGPPMPPPPPAPPVEGLPQGNFDRTAGAVAAELPGLPKEDLGPMPGQPVGPKSFSPALSSLADEMKKRSMG